jgi:hypothetical protein
MALGESQPQGNALQGAAYGGGRFVAVGRAGSILSSADGLTWTAQASNTADDLRDVAWSGSAFVAVAPRAPCTPAPTASPGARACRGRPRT